MTCCAGTIPAGPARFDPGVRKKIEEERVRSMSLPLEGGLMMTRFIVPDMHCIACIRKIEDALLAASHVRYARANLSLREVTVRWDSNSGTGNGVIAALSGTGFSFHFADQETEIASEDQREKGLLLALAVAGFAAANIMLLSVSVWSGASAETAQLFHLLSGLIAVPAVAVAGRPFFASAIKSLSGGRLNMDVPISLAVVLALVMSLVASLQGDEEAYFDASVTLLFFLLIGRYLDQLMRNRARGASERLVSMSAKGGLEG